MSTSKYSSPPSNPHPFPGIAGCKMPSRALLPLLCRRSARSIPNSSLRLFSTTKGRKQEASSNPPKETSNNARWLSQIKARLGKCILFGLTEEQTRQAGTALKALGEEWRDLVAGREGFLVDRKRAGLLRQKVVWGEMDCMNHVNNVTYIRYAESARINWAHNYAVHIDPKNRTKWSELWTPKGDGLILRSMRTDYKFVSHSSSTHLRFECC